MLTVYQYGEIRRAFRDGMSIRDIARTFHHSRRKVRQIVAEAQPRPYTRTKPTSAPMLGAFHTVNKEYAALASHYAFDPLFCMPARGHEKPYAETRVRVMQQQWATPVPCVGDLSALNALFRVRCVGEVKRTVAGNTEAIATSVAACS